MKPARQQAVLICKCYRKLSPSTVRITVQSASMGASQQFQQLISRSQFHRCILAFTLTSIALWLPSAAASSTPAAAAAPVPTLVSIPSQPTAGKPLTLSASFSRQPASASIPTSRFQLSHTKLLHLVGVGDDLDIFLHWHPTNQTPAAFVFHNVTFPKSGRYLIAMDGLLPEGHMATHTKLVVAGSPRMASGASSNKTSTATAPAAAAGVTVRSVPLQTAQPAVSLASLVAKPSSAAGGGSSNNIYAATLAGPQGASCVPGKAVTYVWTLSHAMGSSSSSTGRPVTDLRMYYGAPMHLAVIKNGLSYIAHEHGDIAGSSTAMPAMAAGTVEESGAMPAGDHAHHGRKLLQHTGHTNMSKTPGANTAVPEKAPAGRAVGGSPPAAKGTFGPSIKTEVVFPSAGRYLLVGQVSRGNELILLPLFVSCTGR